MAIASMIIQPAAGRTAQVADAVAAIQGVSVHSVDEKGEVIVLTEADCLDSLNRLARRLETVAGVLGVFPAYVTTADEEEEC